MVSVKRLLQMIQARYLAQARTLRRYRNARRALARAGLDYGTPGYKRSKNRQRRYLRIVRPAVDGQPRQFVYVGANPDKQRAALAAIERGRQYEALTEAIQAIERQQSVIQTVLAEVAADLKDAHDVAGVHGVQAGQPVS